MMLLQNKPKGLNIKPIPENQTKRHVRIQYMWGLQTIYVDIVNMYILYYYLHENFCSKASIRINVKLDKEDS